MTSKIPLVYCLKQDSLELTLKIKQGYIFNRTDIDVILTGDLALPLYENKFYNKRINVRLYTEHSIRNGIDHIYIIDLVGSSAYEETRGRGVGTLLVNTILQYLKNNYSPNTRVYGNITEDDPYIVDFWERFGFKINSFSPTNQKITSVLSDLKINRSPKILNNIWETFIPLDNLTK